MIWSVLYDSPSLESAHDPSVSFVNDFGIRITKAAYPGAHLVEFMPWMMRIPKLLAKWKREATWWHEHDTIKFGALYDDVRRRIVSRMTILWNPLTVLQERRR